MAVFAFSVLVGFGATHKIYLLVGVKEHLPWKMEIEDAEKFGQNLVANNEPVDAGPTSLTYVEPGRMTFIWYLQKARVILAAMEVWSATKSLSTRRTSTVF